MTGHNRLFDTDPFQRDGTDQPGRTEGVPLDRPSVGDRAATPVGRVVRVVPDVAGLDKTFDYLCPPHLIDRVDIGSMVRVELHGRRVGGWVVAVDSEPPPGVTLQPIRKFSSVGPPPELVELATWTAHHWSGRVARVLKAASPQRMVPMAPSPRSSRPGSRPSVSDPESRSAAQDVGAGHDGGPGLAAAVFGPPQVTAVQLAPNDDQRWLVAEAARRGDCLVVIPELRRARNLVRWLRRQGIRSHFAADDWAGGLGGGVVVGSRSAVWAPVADLATVLVLDEHDESLQEERAPTWHARDVAVERARRVGAHCVMAGPCLSVAGRAVADRVVEIDRRSARRGWPALEVIDRRPEEPGRSGLFSPRLVQVLRSSPSAVLILNRKGRARLLACASCGELVRTEDGRHLMVEIDSRLVAPVSGESRPLVCAVCAGTSLKRLRLGVTRATEELERLVAHEVIELTGDRAESPVDLVTDRIVLGTEAALFRHHYRAVPDGGGPASPTGETPGSIRPLTPVVAFLDMDQELLAPRYRAAEQALVLLARAARLVGGRSDHARIVVQTRNPDHRTLRAALSADPSELIDAELEQRRLLDLPPFAALAEVSGRDAADLARRLDRVGSPAMTVLGPRPDGRYLVKAADRAALAEGLAAVHRGDLRTRVAVDPPRV